MKCMPGKHVCISMINFFKEYEVWKTIKLNNAIHHDVRAIKHTMLDVNLLKENIIAGKLIAWLLLIILVRTHLPS